MTNTQLIYKFSEAVNNMVADSTYCEDFDLLESSDNCIYNGDTFVCDLDDEEGQADLDAMQLASEVTFHNVDPAVGLSVISAIERNLPLVRSNIKEFFRFGSDAPMTYSFTVTTDFIKKYIG